MAERVVIAADGIYRWVGPAIGRTIFGARRGSLVLTSEHLVFRSADRGRWVELAWAVAGTVPGVGGVAAGVADLVRKRVQRRTRRLPVPGDVVPDGFLARSEPGSVVIPLGAMREYEVVVRRTAVWLRVAFLTDDGPAELSFNDRIVLPDALDWGRGLHRGMREHGLLP